jgi:hypothetical protein
MFGFGSNKKKHEDTLAEWLAQSKEFGATPKSAKYKRGFKAKIVGEEPMEIHLIEYVMPDGKTGRGFVKPSGAFAFDAETSGISDEELTLAYCGMDWLLPRLSSGTIQTEFQAEGHEEDYLEQKQNEGFENIKVTGRYMMGENAVFELEATHGGQPAKCAGNCESDTSMVDSDPCYALPTIYFLVGAQVVRALT